MINLTELWLSKYRANIQLSRKPKTLDEYYERILQLIPIHLAWSEPFKILTLNKEAEILFVTMKSNEIACFLISKESENVRIELIYLINTAEIEVLNEHDDDIIEDESSVETLISFMTSKRIDSKQVSTVTFLNATNKFGFLVLGFGNGSILISNINLQLHSYIKDFRPKFFQVKNILKLGKIESVDAYKIIETTESIQVLLVIKQLNTLTFVCVDFDNKKESFSVISKPLFHKICQNKNSKDDKQNFVIKSHSKIIKIELMDKIINKNNSVLKFWTVSENSVIRVIKLKVKFNIEKSTTEYLEIIGDHIINDSVQLKFDTNRISKDSNEQFKMTRELFMSNDNSIIFQINDYSKLELAVRKVTQLEINLYQINQHENIIEKILPTSTEPFNEIEMKSLYQKGKYLRQSVQDYLIASLFSIA